VNGEIRQDGSTADTVSGVAELIAYISQVMTLEPGDVVEVEIEGIGILRNPVVSQALVST